MLSTKIVLIPYNKIPENKVNNIVEDYKMFFEKLKITSKSGKEIIIPFTLTVYYYMSNIQDYSYDTLHRILISNNICSYFSYRSPKRKIKFNLQNDNIKERKIIEIISQSLDYKLSKNSQAIRKKRIIWQVIEIDGCIHEWIPEIGKCNILATIDAGTGMMLSASLDWQETNKSYIEVILMLVEKYGLPEVIYGDHRRSIFSDGINSTKITSPLNNLGVVLKCQSFLEHKLNVESIWRRLQQLLLILFHYSNIKAFEEFALFVKNELCDWYNKRFKKLLVQLIVLN